MMNKRLAGFALILFLFILAGEPSAGIETTAVFEQPLLLTSAGQSADVQIASVLIKKAGLDYSLSKLAAPKDLEGRKTLVLVLGASLKGLGAAGLDIGKERERVGALLKTAREKNIPVFCLHLGGADRRGQTTDDFIQETLPSARLALVVKSGNSDGIFTRICREKGITLIEVEKTIEAVEPIQQAFK